MKQIYKKIRPASGFSSGLHLLLTLLLPILVYIFVRINLSQLAVGLVLISKWRVLAVRPRHWLAYIRANAVDIVVGISIVVFMTNSSTQIWQLIWALVYATWLLLIKPSATLLGISTQAFIAQICGLISVYLTWGGSPLYVLVIATWAVTYVSARHFFSSFDEPYSRFLSDAWAFFAAALSWLLGHWLIYYGVVSQTTLLLSVLGFGTGAMYYLEKDKRLSPLLRKQFIFIMLAVVVVILVFSDWSDKAI